MKITQKENIRKLLRYTPTYRKLKITLLSPFDEELLQKAILKAIKNVPFYKEYSQYLSTPFSIESFPIIRKKDLISKEELLVSRKSLKPLLTQVETGGSTGVSLKLFRSPQDIIKENVFVDYAFSLIGGNLRIAVLRGQKPANNLFYERVNKYKIILSTYLLSEDTLDDYLKLLRENDIDCLHVYPSSLSLLARLVKTKYGQVDLPRLRGILSSSEIFSQKERELINEVFPNIKIIDYYGHNELACCAFSIDGGFYHFFEGYGFVEFLETDERVNGNRIAEIIATSIMNTTMPFIRYGTEDYVELDSQGRVVSIIGRSSDFVVNKKKKLVPCIVLTRNKSLQEVINFQYYQPSEGELIFRVVVTDKFSELDTRFILEDLNSSFLELMDCKVSVVDSIEKTRTGKQKRLIQEINIDNYK